MKKHHSTTRRPPTKDREFMERLEQLAKEALHVRARAEEIAEGMGRLPSHDVFFRDLHKKGLYFMACGTRENIEGIDSEEEIKRFWNTVRALVATQFGGFSLAGGKAIKEVLSSWNTASDTGRSLFWNFFKPTTDALPGYPFARALSLLSLFSIVLPRVPTSNEDETRKAIRQRSDRIIRQLLHKNGENLSRGKLLWHVRLLKIVRNLVPEVFKEQEDKPGFRDLERRVRDDLAISLQHANVDTPEFEVAEMVGVLGGRYLNPGAQIEPGDRALYSQAVQYVLKGRHPGKGIWGTQDGGEREKELKNPLAGRYSPLAFLLDLPNQVLLPCLGVLTDAVADALGTLKRELDGYAVKLREDHAIRLLEPQSVNKAVYDGLMIGAAVANRLKDLLSDVELDELGAEIPTEALSWEAVSNSLNFRQNLDFGVIDLWKKWSDERPGAILIFGPPGTGKTSLAKALLSRLNAQLNEARGGGPDEDWRFLALSPADFARAGSDKVIASAERLFRRLQRVRRCIVLLDEMEEFLRARGPEASPESRLITTAFLPLLQETVRRREIILIVATNFVGTIDPAVTRRGRFDLILPLGPPDETAREDIVREMLNAGIDQMTPQISLLTKKVELVARYTMGYTRDEIRDYVKELSSASFGNEELETELWRIRQERVPIALSGNPGCNWRTFRDEAARFTRAPGPVRIVDDPKYWDEPPLPQIGADAEGGKSKAKNPDTAIVSEAGVTATI